MGNASPPHLAYVLDDEPAVGPIVSRMLASLGYDARYFSAWMALLAEIKLQSPSLIVLDLALGNSDAVEVIRHLQVIEFQGKVLLISGRDETTLIRISRVGSLHELAMLPPLQKPFRLADLARSLQAEPHLTTSTGSDDNLQSTAPAVDLGQALRNKWLEVWYQPKVRLKDLTVCGAEALLRAKHPHYGIAEPRTLLPPAGHPLYQPLTSFMVTQSLLDWSRFPERERIKLAVNIPVSALQSANFVASIRDSLPKDPKFPGMIFEVTEDEAIGDPALIQEIAAQLRIYGVWLSIDDFGAGYSSFSRLQDLPFSEVKLDGSFVTNCSTDGAKQLLCSAVIDLAHGFGATVCAERVERMDDLKTLRELRCDTAQGYLFAKPMPFEQFTKGMRGPVPGVV